MHTCMLYVHAYMRTYLHTYTCMHVCGYKHMYAHIHTYIKIHIHTYNTWMHTYIHTYIHTHIHTYIHTYIRYVTIHYRFVSFWFRLYGKVESFKRTIRFVCLFNCLLAEQRRNDCIETKLSCSLHIQLGVLYKRVALGDSLFLPFTSSKRCTAVQETTNFPLCANGLA